MPQIKHSWAALARAQMGTTQTQLCFFLGIWARFGIIYLNNDDDDDDDNLYDYYKNYDVRW